jgi:hypothetical protein
MKTFRSAALTSSLAVVTSFLALGASGCFIQIGEEGATSSTSTTGATHPAPSGTSTPTTPPLPVSIDPGATLSMSPGHQVGVYVESTGAGHWRVITTCDTAISGSSCSFDLNVTPEAGSKFSAVAGENTTASDAMTELDDGTIQLVTQTKYAAAGLSFDAQPGALIEVNMLLDGVPQTGVVHWVSGGMVRDGVPSNPVDFVPRAP